MQNENMTTKLMTLTAFAVEIYSRKRLPSHQSISDEYFSCPQ
jgi:hypothetical protein